jgi:hypothetical protein
MSTEINKIEELIARGKNIPNKEWIITNDRFIAFIDILGFKDLVQRTEHEELKDKMLRILSIIKDFIERRNQEVNKDINKNFESDLIEYQIFSDSIFICTNTAEYNHFTHFILLLKIITFTLLKETIAFKGCISFGKITFDENSNLIFGQPIIDAYTMQEELKYIGIVLDNNAENEIKRIGEIRKSRHENDAKNSNHAIDFNFKFTKTPFKSGKINHFNLILFREEDLNLISKYYEKVSSIPRIYVDNTIEIYNEIFGKKDAPYTLKVNL